jgi:hypothetical protein
MLSNNTSGRLYRILSFDRAVQIFEKGELYFAQPSTWPDPYEVSLVHPNSHKLFGQCWCTRGVSDAMWRIYSPDHLGVRISTSTRKLRQALAPELTRRGHKLRLENVGYLSPHELRSKVSTIRKELAAEFDVQRAMDALFLKREAFDHESECRAVIYCPEATKVQARKGIKIQIDPHQLIDSVLLDPRAPDELASALAFYFKGKLKFTKRVQRSVLYKSPKPLVVE